MSIPLPLTQRRGDILIVAFFLLNLCYITYMVDLEQLIIPDPAHFTYPVWPPRFAVDADHWWGRAYDPLLLAWPVWWKMTIVTDEAQCKALIARTVTAYGRVNTLINNAGRGYPRLIAQMPDLANVSRLACWIGR